MLNPRAKPPPGLAIRLCVKYLLLDLTSHLVCGLPMQPIFCFRSVPEDPYLFW